MSLLYKLTDISNWGTRERRKRERYRDKRENREKTGCNRCFITDI
jgi:hypothetical protein